MFPGLDELDIDEEEDGGEDYVAADGIDVGDGLAEQTQGLLLGYEGVQQGTARWFGVVGVGGGWWREGGSGEVGEVSGRGGDDDVLE